MNKVKIGELQVCDVLIQKFYLMLLLSVFFNLMQVLYESATENIIDIDTSETSASSFEQICDLVGGFDIRSILTKNRTQDSMLTGKKLYARCLRDFTVEVLKNFLANLSERTLPLVSDFLRAVLRVQQAAELLEEDGMNDWFDFFKKALMAKCKKYNFSEQSFDGDLSLAFYRAVRPTKPQLSGTISPLPPISSEMQAAVQETVNYIDQRGSLSLNRLLVSDKATVNSMEANAIFLPTEGYPTLPAHATTKKYVDEFAGTCSITMENVGTGAGEVYKNRVGTVYYMHKLKSSDTSNIAITTSGDDVNVATTTDVNIAGTLNSTGNFSVATNKFAVAAETGQAVLAGPDANLVFRNNSGDVTCSISSQTGNICSCGQIAGAQASCSVSDAHIKTDIKNLDASMCLEKINQLRPVAFKFIKEWREKNHQEEKVNFGLIAQEVSQIVPEIVVQKDFSSNDVISTVSYEQLIPYLIGSVKALTQEVKNLKEQLAQTH